MTHQKKIISYLVLALAILFAGAVNASDFQAKQTIYISSEVNEDCYLAGANILIEAPIRGDVVAAAGDITIKDTISEDAILAGGTLKIDGYIGDDLRVGGGTITINDRVDGDVLIAGGQVTIGRAAIINGRLTMVSGELFMNGTINGEVDIRGGEVVWNGTAKDAVTIYTEELNLNGTINGPLELAAREIELGSDAKLYGSVEYWTSDKEFAFGSTLLNGASSTFNDELSSKLVDMNWKYAGFSVFAFWIYRLLTAAVIIALVILLFHRFFTRNSEEAGRNYANHLAYGLLYVVGIPVVIILAFATIIGIPAGFIMMAVYGMTLALGTVLASVLIAYGINAYYDKNWNRSRLFFVALLAFLALKVVGAIPFLGWLVTILVGMTALGTLIYIWWQNRKTEPQVSMD